MSIIDNYGDIQRGMRPDPFWPTATHPVAATYTTTYTTTSASRCNTAIF